MNVFECFFNFFNYILDVLIAFILMASFACCMYIRHKLCPDNDMLSDIELEDIRLERVSDKEKTILGKINQMKVRHNYYFRFLLLLLTLL